MPLRELTFVSLFALVLTHGADADAQSSGFGVELRATSTFAYRGSRGGEPGAPENQSVHLGGRGSLRVFPRAGHGVVLEGESLEDIDLDGLSDESFHIVDLRVAHVGYAYRHFTRIRPTRAFSVTPIVVATAGVANEGADAAPGAPARNAVFGLRVGVDFGGHFGRLVVGFGYHYGVLAHTGGPVRVSQLFVGNLLFAQIGVTLGAPHLTFVSSRSTTTCRVVMRGRDVPGACPPRDADRRMHEHDP